MGLNGAPMKIAVIGTGIAGNLVAHRLCRDHDVHVFEAGDHIGGHTHTHDIAWGGRSYAVDTGFIVFNLETYPRFTALLDELGVARQASDMSFSVKCERSGLEYNGSSFNTLFAQRRNLVRLSFHRMLRDIVRFNREAKALVGMPYASLSLRSFLQQGGYCREFIEQYLVPMSAAIWSADPARVFDFPASFVLRFFHNHGLLNIQDRPQWYVIRGGSREYVRRLCAPYVRKVRLRTPVRTIRRHADHVMVKAAGCEAERFDQVFIATHSDQALAMLGDATDLERQVLGAIRFQRNEAVLHTDASLMPKRRLAWAAWNYHIPAHAPQQVPVTYNMNILQGLAAPVQFCVTLNHSHGIRPDTVLKRLRYDHPVFDTAAVAAQRRHAELNGERRTYYCGAYWRYGFHEDGVTSALTALQHFEERQHAQLPLRRTG